MHWQSLKLLDDSANCNANKYHDLINLIKIHLEDYVWDKTIYGDPEGHDEH
jgi:hypothetical protein